MVQGPIRRMSARMVGSVFERWRRAAGVMARSSSQAVERHRALHALELAKPDVLALEIDIETRARFSGEHDLAALGLRGEPRRDVGGHAGRGIGPAGPRPPLDLGGAEEGGAGVDADVHAQGIEAALELRADLRGAAVNGPGRVHRRPRMIALVEDDHEPVPRRLVDVAAVLDDLVEEGAEEM